MPSGYRKNSSKLGFQKGNIPWNKGLHKVKLFKCIRCEKKFDGDSHWKTRTPKYCSKKCMLTHYIQTGRMNWMSTKSPRIKKVSDKKVLEAYKLLKNHPTLTVGEVVLKTGLSKSWGTIRLKRLVGKKEYKKLKKYKYGGRSVVFRGKEAEVKIAKKLRKEGYEVYRSVGSRGKYDLIAYNEKDLIFIQVKRSISNKNQVGSKEMAKLKADKIPFGRKEIWHWIDGKNQYSKKIIVKVI